MCSEVINCKGYFDKVSGQDRIYYTKDMSDNNDVGNHSTKCIKRIIRKPETAIDSVSEIGGCRIETTKLLDILKEVTLAKSYAVLKDEMEDTTAKSIASHLFANDRKLLSEHDHEIIQNAKGRRDVVEKLLKRILIGDDALYDGFNDLINEKYPIIANIISKIKVTDKDMKVYKLLKKSTEKSDNRPNSDRPRLKFSINDRDVLIYYLNRQYFIDQINDQLLSRLTFSIREHTNIVNCSIDREVKVTTLLDTLELCEDVVLEDMCEVLKSLRMEHVPKELEIVKHKEAESLKDKNQPSSSKRKRDLDQLDEPSVVKRMKSNEPRIDKILKNELGFSLEDVTEGSIVLQIKPNSKESWNILKRKCRSGEIKDFIPEVFRNEVENIREGERIFKLTIYILTNPRDYENSKALIELANHHISRDIQDIICEELEITDELLEVLIRKKVVSTSIKDELQEFNRRKERIQYLLDQLEKSEKDGYELLKQYVKARNEYLYDKIMTEEGIKTNGKTIRSTCLKGSFSSSLDGKKVIKEVFFMADIVIAVGNKAETMTRGTQRHSPEFQMTCPRLINPCCYFNEELDPGIEIDHKKLEDTWHYASNRATGYETMETANPSKDTGFETDEETNSTSKASLRRAASTEGAHDRSFKTKKTDIENKDIPRPLTRSKKRGSDKRKK